jgi:ABC-type polysaccharide/polyol phosphate transport system ATPase subunit
MTPAPPRIEARNLTKEFQVVHRTGTLKRLILSLGRREKPQWKAALRDISFEIRPGEAVGLIGRNGSGKSTLLSLIGRIYRETSGVLEVTGRVAPLLELGAGFHRELTGRENVYLNGVILGLRRAEVEERFDAIVEFSELEEKIDTPVRNYSSGQLMRLGFAIASHTDAEILLVDEILAPADEEFQEKCYARLARFRQEGRIILFVSHDPDAVRRVAGRALWLDHGNLHADGAVEPVLSHYLKESHAAHP